ncbi:methyltransferase [Campylobacterota bacterium]|nr:methyltransferase [Campylobacterota bacterium]
MIKPNNLQTIDFAALYRAQKVASDFRPKSADDWNEKAALMSAKLGGIYPEKLCSLIDSQGSETLLDIGSGVGTIALELASKFKKIYAVDFSPKMLAELSKNAADRGIKNIEAIEANIEESWEKLPQADIAIASRSMEVSDIQTTLKNLNDHALKKVYLTYKVGGSFLHAPILEAIGRSVTPKPDYIYIVNVLYTMGIYAKVDFIPSEGKGFNYHNEDGYIQSVEWSLGALTDDEKQKLVQYFDRLRREDRLRDDPLVWALIHWEKDS